MDVGGYTGASSPSGAFDLGGNAAEWTETFVGVEQFVVVGGDFSSPVSVLDRMDAGIELATMDEESPGLGFRMAPDPGSGIMLLVGSGALAGLARRRRRDRSSRPDSVPQVPTLSDGALVIVVALLLALGIWKSRNDGERRVTS